uniref:Biogenesis of lysosome-related organelles complex 1 subunit 1 n=1 Tax=Timema bartmani TaxID=61472 RepID=A0A7R9EM52_9NEOP|nr:unnamed protein product [Timema bartmani]
MARGDGVDVEEYDNRKHGWPRSSTQAQEQKRKEAMAAANNLTQALVDHLNVGVAQAYLNQKRLDAEAKQLHHNATNFAKQTHQWANLVESFSSALKEIGDAENWAQSIEADMRTITSALEYSYKGLCADRPGTVVVLPTISNSVGSSTSASSGKQGTFMNVLIYNLTVAAEHFDIVHTTVCNKPKLWMKKT